MSIDDTEDGDRFINKMLDRIPHHCRKCDKQIRDVEDYSIIDVTGWGEDTFMRAIFCRTCYKILWSKFTRVMVGPTGVSQ